MEAAHVSFAMGSGSSVARNKASMVLIEDNFQSCIQALMRGRNIYSNIKRFLQFQITVNYSILICILISVLWLSESPFNAVMLIWINLVMDVLAALALATGPPLPQVISEPAVMPNNPIISDVLWRQIYGITAWNVLIMSIVILFGKNIFNLDYQKSDPANTSIPKSQHYTIIFNTFIFLAFFNQINCRVVGARDFNVFTGVFRNWIFIVVLAVIFGVQWAATETNGFSLVWLFRTAAIDRQTFWTCVFYGSSALFASFVLKLTPVAWVAKVPVKLDEDKVLGGDSKIVGIYHKAAKNKQAVTDTNDDDFHAPEEADNF